MRPLILALLLMLVAVPAQAATIADAAWLSGRWQGQGMGGELQEAWSDPVDGQMTGHFVLVRDGKVVFRQILLIQEQDGVLSLKVKHFDRDFKGWEEKDASVDFAFVSASPEALVFKSLKFERDGADGLVLTLRFRTADGLGRDEVLRYTRKP